MRNDWVLGCGNRHRALFVLPWKSNVHWRPKRFDIKLRWGFFLWKFAIGVAQFVCLGCWIVMDLQMRVSFRVLQAFFSFWMALTLGFFWVLFLFFVSWVSTSSQGKELRGSHFFSKFGMSVRIGMLAIYKFSLFCSFSEINLKSRFKIVDARPSLECEF